jgi:hypothetical protein
MEEACASLAGGIGLEKGEGRFRTHRDEWNGGRQAE